MHNVSLPLTVFLTTSMYWVQAASRFAQERAQEEEDELENYDYWVSFFSTGKDEHIQKYECL